MQSQIVDLVRDKYPQFEVRKFTRASIDEKPLVLVGSLAGFNKAGEVSAPARGYWIWLVLADLEAAGSSEGNRPRRCGERRSHTHGILQRQPGLGGEGPVHRRVPQTCGGKVGDPIDPTYLDGILTAALVGDAIEAYEVGRYQDALDLYADAASMPTGDQQRVDNGFYLANWRLGRQKEAAEAFGHLVDYGLRSSGWRSASCSSRARRRSGRPSTSRHTPCGSSRSRLGACGAARPRDHWTHQPHGLRGVERKAVRAAGRAHQVEAGSGGVRARRSDDHERRRVAREHHRHRGGRREGRARPQGGVQGPLLLRAPRNPSPHGRLGPTRWAVCSPASLP